MNFLQVFCNSLSCREHYLDPLLTTRRRKFEQLSQGLLDQCPELVFFVLHFSTRTKYYHSVDLKLLNVFFEENLDKETSLILSRHTHKLNQLTINVSRDLPGLRTRTPGIEFTPLLDLIYTHIDTIDVRIIAPRYLYFIHELGGFEQICIKIEQVEVVGTERFAYLFIG